MSQSMIESQAEFSLNLLRNVDYQNSAILSPISILIALGMTLLGAKENTAKEIRNTIGKGMDLLEIHDHFLNIQHSAESESCTFTYVYRCHSSDNSNIISSNPKPKNLPLICKQDSNCTASIKIVNKLYFSDEINILDSFQMDMEKYYKGNFQLLDFTDAEKAIDIINDFVANSTENKIDKIVEADSFNPDTKMILINAIFFDKNWETNFKRHQGTTKFLSASSANKEIPMLEKSIYCGYFENDLFQFLELPYEGRNYSMFILLPREIDGISSIIENLSASKILEAMTAATPDFGKVIIPKFTVSTSYDVQEFLKKMNISDAFNKEKADFSGVTSSPLFISKIIQKSRIEVDESGTRAVSVTFSTFEPKSGTLPQSFEFIADHPFLYFIADKEKNVFFIGTFYG